MADSEAPEVAAQLPCKWLYKLPEGNKCWCTDGPVDATGETRYCTGQWQECETYRTTDSTDDWDSC